MIATTVVAAAATPSAASQLLVDFCVVIVVLGNGLLGWGTGLVRRAIVFGGVYLGVYVGTLAGNSAAGFFAKGDPEANSWGFVICFLVVVGATELVTFLYRDKLASAVAVSFDRVTGALAGAAVGFLEFSVIVIVLLALKDADSRIGQTSPTAAAVQSATISSWVVSANPTVRQLFAPALPSDFPKHLSENAPQGTPTP